MGRPLPPAISAERREREEGFTALLTFLAVMSEHADEIARFRRTMYLAYVQAGFTESQALELARSSAL